MRQRIYEIVERAKDGDTGSFIYDIFIAFMAIVSVIRLLVDTGNMPAGLTNFVYAVDSTAVSVLFFDYIMRWITYDIDCAQRGKKRSNGQPLGWIAFVSYPFTPLAIIELISLLPSIIPMPAWCQYLIILRLTKVFRMLRGLAIIRKVFIREGRTLLSILFVTLLYVLCVALIMYTYEPDIFDNFLDAFYWSTTALATIGYGDISPQTQLGKIINILSALVGVTVVALPSGIITGGYVSEVKRQRKEGTQLARSFNTEYTSLEEVIEKGAHDTNKSHEHKSLTHYFKQHPKVLQLIIVVIVCTLLNTALYVIASNLWVYIPIDNLGSVFAAFLLEPTAGILVGYFANLVYAINMGDVSGLLYLFADIVVSVIFGAAISLKRGDGTLHLKKDAVVLVVAALCMTVANTLCGLVSGNLANAVETFNGPGGLNASTLLLAALILFVSSLLSCTVYYALVLLIRPLKRYTERNDAHDAKGANQNGSSSNSLGNESAISDDSCSCEGDSNDDVNHA